MFTQIVQNIASLTTQFTKMNPWTFERKKISYGPAFIRQYENFTYKTIYKFEQNWQNDCIGMEKTHIISW